jgi:aspartate oxidase
MRMKHSLLIYLAFSSLLILPYACISGPDSETSYNTSSGTGGITFALSLQDSPINDADRHAAQQLDCDTAGVETVEREVYDANDSLLARGGPWECADHKGKITGVPVGSNRKVVILCKNSSGDTCYRGEVTGITVIAGQTTEPIDITLEPTYQADQDW